MPHVVQKLVAVDEQPDPKTNSIMVKPDGPWEGPFIKSTGDVDLACSNCGTILAEGVARGQISGVFLRCKCGKYCLAQ